jgi:hypothetical protein
MYKKVFRIVQIKTGPEGNWYLIIKRLLKINLETFNIRIKLMLQFFLLMQRINPTHL